MFHSLSPKIEYKTSIFLLQTAVRNNNLRIVRTLVDQSPYGLLFDSIGFEHIVYLCFNNTSAEAAQTVEFLLAKNISRVVGNDKLAFITPLEHEHELWSNVNLCFGFAKLRVDKLSRKDALHLALARAAMVGNMRCVRVLLDAPGVDAKWRRNVCLRLAETVSKREDVVDILRGAVNGTNKGKVFNADAGSSIPTSPTSFPTRGTLLPLPTGASAAAARNVSDALRPSAIPTPPSPTSVTNTTTIAAHQRRLSSAARLQEGGNSRSSLAKSTKSTDRRSSVATPRITTAASLIDNGPISRPTSINRDVSLSRPGRSQSDKSLPKSPPLSPSVSSRNNSNNSAANRPPVVGARNGSAKSLTKKSGGSPTSLSDKSFPPSPPTSSPVNNNTNSAFTDEKTIETTPPLYEQSVSMTQLQEEAEENEKQDVMIPVVPSTMALISPEKCQDAQLALHMTATTSAVVTSKLSNDSLLSANYVRPDALLIHKRKGTEHSLFADSLHSSAAATPDLVRI
ncbi:UNVERIFIED_CONTAM: hypothetical protein HDU68_000936, partial [Siphonaria sp. JEL0065]